MGVRGHEIFLYLSHLVDVIDGLFEDEAFVVFQVAAHTNRGEEVMCSTIPVLTLFF